MGTKGHIKFVYSEQKGNGVRFGFYSEKPKYTGIHEVLPQNVVGFNDFNGLFQVLV